MTLSAHHHYNCFTVLFPGPSPGWAGARRELLDFMMIFIHRCKGRSTEADTPHRPSGWAPLHPDYTMQSSPPSSPHDTVTSIISHSLLFQTLLFSSVIIRSWIVQACIFIVLSQYFQRKICIIRLVGTNRKDICPVNNSVIFNDLEWPWRSISCCKPFQMWFLCSHAAVDIDRILIETEQHPAVSAITESFLFKWRKNKTS